MSIEKGRRHCILALSTEPGTSCLFNPPAFTPVELRRMASVQVRRGREVHLLIQFENGVQEVTFDYRNANLSGNNDIAMARELGECMELSNGFFFVSPTR